MASFSPEQLKHGLSGPVYPILTPFSDNDSRSVDLPALSRYVGKLVDAGVGAVMTTVGTSRFNLLSNDEIKLVNETVAKAADGRCVTILAGPQTGDTSVNLEFCRHAAFVGADAYIAVFPERFYGDAPIFEFFRSLSDSTEIGVMIHETPMRSGYGGQRQYSLDLLDRLTDLPNLVGMKEECMDGGYAYKLHRRLSDKCWIIGAGSMRNAMRDFHAGGRAYLVGVGSFFPCVELAFHSALTAGRIEEAHGIVRQYEDAYFDLAVELGWHVALKETLNVLGLMPAAERPPLPQLDASQRERLTRFIQEVGWMVHAFDHRPV